MADITIDNRIWSFKGAIGRREFILNATYVATLLMLLMIPYMFWIIQNPDKLYGTSNVLEIFKASPLYVKMSLLLSWLVGIPFNFGLKSRRLSDILSRNTDWSIYFAVGMLILAAYWASLTANYLTLLLVFIIEILFYCIKGKVTGQLPKDEVKRFNWGAFWGTWIWGLINRSYKTLWAIPAFIFFPIFIYVQIICGIKGNEWAYEKAKNKELSDFHRGQKHQATFWNIFTGIFIFILPVLFIAVTTVAAFKYVAANPDSVQNAVMEYNQRVEAFVDEYFESYELSGIENKFYLDPQKWVDMSEKQRQGLLYYIAAFVSTKKGETEALITTPSQQLIITKIYSSYNNEILSEFVINKPGNNVKEIMKSRQNSVRVNNNPALP